MPLPQQGYRLGMGGGRLTPPRRPIATPVPSELPPPELERIPLPIDVSRLPQPEVGVPPQIEPEGPDIMRDYLAATRQAPMPMRSDIPPPGRLQRALGAIATGWMGGREGPEAAQKTHDQIFDRPYNRAMGEWGQQEAMRRQRVAELEPAMRAEEAKKTRLEAGRLTREGQSVEAMRRRLESADARAERMGMREQANRLAREKMGEMASKTIETAEGIFQWNPKTQKYDIPVGKPKPKLLSPEEEAQARRLREAGREGLGLRPVQALNAQGDTVTKFVKPTENLEIPVGETADMRNRKAARERMSPTINSARQLSQKVITETAAVVQRAKASGMSVDAALRGHPTYQAYQAGRSALAVNLAVAKQGSRPTEADVQIELMQIPDVFSDPVETAALKWAMLYINALQPLPDDIKATLKKHGLDPSGLPGQGGGSTAPKRPPGVPPDARWDATAREWVR